MARAFLAAGSRKTAAWNSRFASLSLDPFDNSLGFVFPPPEGLSLADKAHLLVAQAFIPPTERVEAAGFVFPGDNFDLRAEVMRRINTVAEYRKLFGKIFPEVMAGDPITYDMFAQAIAEHHFVGRREQRRGENQIGNTIAELFEGALR